MNAYQKRYVALEVFYLGAAYHGFAYQADMQLTVEVTTELIRGPPASSTAQIPSAIYACPGVYSDACPG